MNDIKVSIIVPVYNAEKYLQRTIEALRQQTLQEIEIILIDDGSRDNSGCICDCAATEDGRICCIHKKNEGVSAARNDGLRIARGKYIMFCDADDKPKAEWAETMYEAILKNEADLAICEVEKKTKKSSETLTLPYSGLISDRNKIIHNVIMPMMVWGYAPEGAVLPNIYGSVWNRIFRKDIIEKNKIIFNAEIPIGEDLLFNLEYIFTIDRIEFINNSLYEYFENANSATHNNQSILWNRYLKLWRAIHSLVELQNLNVSDLNWHNLQLQKYAVSAIVEGVCSQETSAFIKIKQIGTILRDVHLANAVCSVPSVIVKKDYIINVMFRKKMCVAVFMYYQHVFNKNYKGRELL